MLARRVSQAGPSRLATKKPFAAAPVRPSARAYAAVVETKSKDEPVADVVVDDVPDVGLSSQQVSTLLNMICQDTEIAEMHLQMGKFELKVTRNLNGKSSSTAVAAAPAVPASEPSAAYTPAPMTLTLEDSVDESLMYVSSPKVGIFRRGKFAGGKRIGKANCVEQGDQVKKGQVIGYIDQLGTHVAVEAPQAGEIATFLVDDGAPVEYKQEIVEMHPFFGGHIIGDKKYA